MRQKEKQKGKRRSRSRGSKKKEEEAKSDIRRFVNTDVEEPTKRKMDQRSPQVEETAKKEKVSENSHEDTSQKSQSKLVVPWNDSKGANEEHKKKKNEGNPENQRNIPNGRAGQTSKDKERNGKGENVRKEIEDKEKELNGEDEEEMARVTRMNKGKY